MKSISLVFVLFLFLTSCQSSSETTSSNEETTSFPNIVIENDDAFEKLMNDIMSQNPTLDKSTIEIMSFDYHATIHPSTNELSSSIDISFVKGDDKNKIVQYSINTKGELSNGEVDISVGSVLEQKMSNTYETYQPYLFSSEKMNLDILRKIMQESLEKFKKDANIEKAYCASISIEKEYNKEPKISTRTMQYKFASVMMRSYDWTTDGKFIR